MKRVAAVLGFALSLAAAAGARADNFRCPNGSIVSTGDSISEVSVQCDPPSFVSQREGPETVRGRTVYVQVMEWTYNEGPHRLLHFLIFRNGLLTDVKSGGYGR